MAKKKKDETVYHYIDPYIISPTHPVYVLLIGCGGSGSQMLTNLARIHVSLVGLGHPGLHVTACDPDTVSAANIGRQLFSPSELNLNKASALITRINRFFGLRWSAISTRVDGRMPSDVKHNIIITCVDNVATRLCIDAYLQKPLTIGTPFLYWLDLGNSKDFGQVILASANIKQPAKLKSKSQLPSIIQLHPDIKKHEDKDDTPSCSLAEALSKQDLFINSIIANIASDIIWKMFRNLKLEYHGAYINLENLTINPVRV